MPLYEFDCNDCHEPFEKMVRRISAVLDVTCPTCGSKQVSKKLSSFAVKGGSTTAASISSDTSCSTGT